MDILVKNLCKDDSKYLSPEFESNVLDLSKQKGFYPYEYMSDFKKFKEQLPSKEKFSSSLICKNIRNNSLSSSTFPTALKYADVEPVFKKDGKTDKEIYRPISILPNLSKAYERLIYNQMYPYFEKPFFKSQCDFRKGFNAQHCLITMIAKWRRSVDRGGQAGALLTDISKAFDCINHEL